MFESPSELNQGGGLDRNAPLIESRPRPYSKAAPNKIKVATLFEPRELNQGRDLDPNYVKAIWAKGVPFENVSKLKKILVKSTKVETLINFGV